MNHEGISHKMRASSKPIIEGENPETFVEHASRSPFGYRGSLLASFSEESVFNADLLPAPRHLSPTIKEEKNELQEVVSIDPLTQWIIENGYPPDPFQADELHRREKQHFTHTWQRRERGPGDLLLTTTTILSCSTCFKLNIVSSKQSWFSAETLRLAPGGLPPGATVSAWSRCRLRCFEPVFLIKLFWWTLLRCSKLRSILSFSHNADSKHNCEVGRQRVPDWGFGRLCLFSRSQKSSREQNRSSMWTAKNFWTQMQRYFLFRILYSRKTPRYISSRRETRREGVPLALRTIPSRI